VGGADHSPPPLALPIVTPTEINASPAGPGNNSAVRALAAAAILGVLEAGGLLIMACGRRASDALLQGFVWGLVMISGMILLIRLFGGFSFGELALHGPLLWGYAPYGVWSFSR